MAGTAVTTRNEGRPGGQHDSVRLSNNATVADVERLRSRLARMSLMSAGLVITATAGKKIPKIGATDWYGLVEGVLVKVAAGTDMANLAGSVTTTNYNVYVHSVSAAGTLASDMGTEGASLAAIVFPTLSVASAIIGFTIIHPTGTGSFVGNTTALDDGTVVPNAVYISTIGPGPHQGIALASSITGFTVTPL